MSVMNTDASINAQLQNWDNFCQYHAIGDWHGTWTRYNSEGEVIEFFKCIRCLHTNIDGSEINHQNHYTYANGKTETKTFGPYIKPITKALFLENSFSWGSTKVEPSSSFGFETGFRFENMGASAAITYDCAGAGNLQNITIISEQLGSFGKEPYCLLTNEISDNWLGTLKSMTCDLIVSAPEVAVWKCLKDLRDDYQTFKFPGSISISCPRQVQNGVEETLFAVDWRVNDTLLQRGIRHFDAHGFTAFTLQNFTLAS